MYRRTFLPRHLEGNVTWNCLKFPKNIFLIKLPTSSTLGRLTIFTKLIEQALQSFSFLGQQRSRYYRNIVVTFSKSTRCNHVRVGQTRDKHCEITMSARLEWSCFLQKDDSVRRRLDYVTGVYFRYWRRGHIRQSWQSSTLYRLRYSPIKTAAKSWFQSWDLLCVIMYVKRYAC